MNISKLFTISFENILINHFTRIKSKPLIDLSIFFTNRNARIPKKANHGARPCSSVMRRLKKKQHYRRWKEDIETEAEAGKKK